MSDAVVDLTERRKPDAANRPDAMLSLPQDKTKLVRQALEWIEICRNDAGNRAAYCQQINMIMETGKKDGSRSLINLLYRIIDRLSSHLFSPTDIRFSMDFDNEYGLGMLERGKVAARQMARSWERTNTDITFSMGVFEAIKYGGVFLKQWCTQDGPDKLPVYHGQLVMPWQFGVWRPDLNSLDAQPVMCETVMLSMPEVWRRIWMMPDAKSLFDRIKAHAAPGSGQDVQNNFFHQVLSTSPIQTGVSGSNRPVPGGIVQLTNDPTFSSIQPRSTAPIVKMHELYVWGQDDYNTIQIIEPDILIAPRYRDGNLMGVKGTHPYTLIQPNMTHGNIWGRSELADLMEPQDFLSQTAADIKRLFGIQVDKILAFSGDTMTDEMYDQMRAAGYANLGPGGDVKDLTPQFPPESLALVEKIIQIMEMICGFDNMLSGRGETGVRSGVQSNPLMKAAGAPLRDRSLIVERQCAAAADLRWELMKAKDGRTYWTDASHAEETSFLLADIPEDGRMIVDGHSTSAIFADENQQLLVGGLRLGIVDGESAIEGLPFQNKDTLISRLKEKELRQAKMMEDLKQHNPEEWARIIEKQAGGGARRR